MSTQGSHRRKFTDRSIRSSTQILRYSDTQKLVITIDGPAGVGKSTAAKELAKRLGLLYLDTGATYRALAYAALKHGLHAIADADQLARLAKQLTLLLRMTPDGRLQVWLDHVDITSHIRTEEVTEAAAQISQHPAVRAAMVQRQRELADHQSVVVEGRDTGSVVFPHAPVKFFLTASATVRSRRRQLELGHLYGSRPPLTQVKEQLHFRDQLDRTRRVGPLIKPVGAIELDTSHLTARQVVSVMLRQIARVRRTGR